MWESNLSIWSTTWGLKCYSQTDTSHGLSASLSQLLISHNSEQGRAASNLHFSLTSWGIAGKARPGQLSTGIWKQLGTVNSPQQQWQRMTAGQNYCCTYAIVSRIHYRHMRIYSYLSPRNSRKEEKNLHKTKNSPTKMGNMLFFGGKEVTFLFFFSSINVLKYTSSCSFHNTQIMEHEEVGILSYHRSFFPFRSILNIHLIVLIRFNFFFCITIYVHTLKIFILGFAYQDLKGLSAAVRIPVPVWDDADTFLQQSVPLSFTDRNQVARNSLLMAFFSDFAWVTVHLL